MARIAAALLFATAIALLGCSPIAEEIRPVAPFQAIPVGPLGPIFDNPNGPPVECRGIPRRECLPLADMTGDPGIDVDRVVRVIVTCMDVCVSQRGAFRVDLLMRDGTMHDFGMGEWETAP